MSDESTFLFARPSFTEGVARIMDLGATMQVYNNSKTEKEADLKALKKDWEAVGVDIFCAIKSYEQKQENSAV
jgi:hypothetical protein